MVTTATFFNFTDKPFSHTWDGVVYDFAPLTPYLMEDWKARHFAKHLANQVLNENGKSVRDQSRDEILAKALPISAVANITVPESKIETELLNAPGPKPKVGGKKASGKKKAEEEISEEGEFKGV